MNKPSKETLNTPDEVEIKRLFLNKEIELILIVELSSLKFNIFFLFPEMISIVPDAVPKKK